MKKPKLERLPLRPRGSSRERKIQGLDIIICVILVFYAFLIIFPFWNAFVISISSESSYLHSDLLLWPTDLDLSSYKKVFQDEQLWSGFGITMILLIGGTLYQLFFTVITGYALSRKNWTGKNLVMNMLNPRVLSICLSKHWNLTLWLLVNVPEATSSCCLPATISAAAGMFVFPIVCRARQLKTQCRLLRH